MKHLILNLIEHLNQRKVNEIDNIEKYKQNDLSDMILISSGKVMELDKIIQNLYDLLKYDAQIKIDKK